MFQALYNSLSGLFSFSRSLDTVSNNVANMNTPGFRGSDSFFENVNNQHGTRITGEGLRTTPGDIRQTGNATDIAIDGTGFLVLRDEGGDLHYTRAGQFRFDEAGILIDSVTKYQVMAIDATGNLSPITLEGSRTLPAQASTKVTLTGNLAPSSTTYDVSSVNVYDAAGTAHALKLTFTNNTTTTPGSFLVSITDETGADVGPAGAEIRFGTAGTLQAGYSTIELQLTFQGVAQAVTLDFGTPGTFSGATSLAGLNTNLSATVTDGRPVLGINSLSFDDEGVLQIVYNATEKKEGQQLALASFLSESSLKLGSSRLISNADAQRSELGRAGSSVFGKIEGGSLEMSNIDLTQEFADMLIIQRGYQASSRVMTVSNEMIEQLYNSTRGG